VAEREKDIRKFQRAARQRMKAAELLKEHGYNLEAVYLGGYAVECALKGLVLARTPRRLHEEMLERLIGVGAKGHDYTYLRSLMRERSLNLRISAEVNEKLRNVDVWSTDLRYEVYRLEAVMAERFLAASRWIVEWSERS
jgi:HEPN domain-containing protein